MRIVQYVLVSFLLGSITISCHTMNPVDSFEKPIPIDSVVAAIVIPNLYINQLDTSLKFHQDTLYFQSNKFSGYVFKLYTSKDTAFLGTYWNGIEQGVHQKWYPNKQLAEYRIFHLGKKEGKHVGFWEDGKPKFEYHFLEGELQGVTNEWYQNGQPYKVMHYKKGYEEGSQKMWWENGVIRANYVVKQGRRYGLIGLKLCMTPKDSIDFKIK
jgi:antitoxin component YwqK of YwqJK toxin-antitoxin module